MLANTMRGVLSVLIYDRREHTASFELFHTPNQPCWVW